MIISLYLVWFLKEVGGLNTPENDISVLYLHSHYLSKLGHLFFCLKNNDPKKKNKPRSNMIVTYFHWTTGEISNAYLGT